MEALYDPATSIPNKEVAKQLFNEHSILERQI